MTEKPAKYGGAPVRENVLGYGGQNITQKEKRAVTDALDGTYITRGPTVEQFENEIADFVGVDHAVMTTSGTTALHLAGEAAGFDHGDEVITTPLTFAATAFTATYTGAEPVFADVDPVGRTLDPGRVRDQLSSETAGIIPMHYGGHPAAIDELTAIADDHELTVIWDACHAFGGTWRGEKIGSQRDMTVFSFHPVKTITTGEGGMVVTDDDELGGRLRRLRSFDMDYEPPGHENEPWYQVVEGLGYNYNVTDLQAALGSVQLDRLPEFKERRSEIIERYDQAFSDLKGVETPPSAGDADPCYHLYAVEVTPEFGCSRTEFVNAIHAENVGVQVHYVPLHYHPFFQKKYGYERGMYPETERLYERLVSLPLHPSMDAQGVDDVIGAVTRLCEYHSE
jgi:dTDP-4-amino-4,6-dideoxygalactose transaminase